MLLSTKYKENLVTLVVDKELGDEFRSAFSKIGDLRSILPAGINVMALTATATVETFDFMSRRLSMKDPTPIALPPNHDNIIQSSSQSKSGWAN